MQEERYIPLRGLEEFYDVSNLGNVYSKRYNKILKSACSGHGYLVLTLTDKNKKSFTKSVHRMVAESFIPNPEGKEQVNHKNGIKSDNRLENLEWASRSENMLHAIKNNLCTPNPLPRFTKLNHPQTKLTMDDISEIVRRRRSREKLEDIAKDFNIGGGQICKIYKRETGKNLKINL